MKIHFIAIGGSAMHNLAIALRKNGNEVTGSDDEIFEPAKTNLSTHNILPEKQGWFLEKVKPDLDAVILGMHAKADNPELLKAQELGLKIFSFPEYLYEHSKNKKRVVIGGSHGKTSITAMVMSVLKFCGKDFDYLVGAAIKGFDTMVKITRDAPLLVIEGDEYLSSAVDRRPKFHLYKPDIALISGIAWDHINVFPTFENYKEQFRIFAELVPKDGVLIYNEEDEEVEKICEKVSVNKIFYSTHPHQIENGTTYLLTAKNEKIPLQIFGKHNLQNLSGAKAVCNQLGISDEEFYRAIQNFKGAAKRLELVKKNKSSAIYRDFAHSPSKLKATISAVKEQFPDRKLVACMELHTYSSLNMGFLEEYAQTMDEADEAIVYFNAHTLEIKKLSPVSETDVKNAFQKNDLRIFTETKKLEEKLKSMQWAKANLLMMSSGNFDGLDLNELANFVLKNNK